MNSHPYETVFAILAAGAAVWVILWLLDKAAAHLFGDQHVGY